MRIAAAFEFLDTCQDMVMLGSGHMPAFLCLSSPPILFDPGVSAFGPYYLARLRAQLSSTAALTIALTHAHFDHCGALPYLLRHIPTARVAASLRAAEIVQRPRAIELIRRLNAEYEQDMRHNLEAENVSFEAFAVDCVMAEGDRLQLSGGRYCEALATPGHTRDCLSYFFPDSGMAVVGEAAGVLEDGFLHSPFLTSYEDYVASIERLRTLKPDALCIAHNGILTGARVQQFLALSLGAAVSYKRMIATCLERYHNDQQCVVEHIVAQEYDARPNPIQKRAAFILNLEAKVRAVAEAGTATGGGSMAGLPA